MDIYKALPIEKLAINLNILMHSDSSFKKNARAFLDHLLDRLENSFLEYEETEDSLKIQMPDQKIYLFNIHHGLKQIWWSSPFSGGHHFAQEGGCWTNTRTQGSLMETFADEMARFYPDVSL